MKKSLIALIVLLACAFSGLAEDKIPIILVHKKDSTTSMGGPQRTPVCMPNAYIDDYVLTFDASCVGCLITILDADSVVVFSAAVDENLEVILPSILTECVTYELLLQRGNLTFQGYFVIGDDEE